MPELAVIARLAALVWAAFTAVLLLLPGSAFQAAAPGWERFEQVLALCVHFVLFLVLAWLVRRSGTRDSSSVIVILATFCVILEVAQIWIPNRTFEFPDIAMGCLGIGWVFRDRWVKGRADEQR